MDLEKCVGFAKCRPSLILQECLQLLSRAELRDAFVTFSECCVQAKLAEEQKLLEERGVIMLFECPRMTQANMRIKLPQTLLVLCAFGLICGHFLLAFYVARLSFQQTGILRTFPPPSMHRQPCLKPRLITRESAANCN